MSGQVEQSRSRRISVWLAVGFAAFAGLLGFFWLREARAPEGPAALAALDDSAAIVVTPLARVTGGRTGFPDHVRAAKLLSDGRALVSTYSSSQPLLLVDTGQQSVASAFTVGMGPGEVTGAAALHRDAFDTLFVLDDLSRRLHVLAPDGSYVQAVGIGVSAFAPDLVRAHTGHLVIAGSVASAGRLGQPLHLVRRDGTIARSFGADGSPRRAVTADERLAASRLLAVESSGNLLSVRPGSYVLERWSPEGDSLGRWDLAPDWFAPANQSLASSHEEPPPPRVTGLQVDAAGRVWVLVLRAGTDWQRGVSPPRRPPSLFEITDLGAYVDTQVEVFDASTFTRLASVRLSRPLGGFVAPGIVLGLESSDEAGNPVADLYQLTLRSP